MKHMPDDKPRPFRTGCYWVGPFRWLKPPALRLNPIRGCFLDKSHSFTGIEPNPKTILTASMPWRDAFPEFKNNVYGTLLSGYRHREGMTQEALSRMTGIPRRHISEMENGKRPIEKETAFPSS